MLALSIFCLHFLFIFLLVYQVQVHVFKLLLFKHDDQPVTELYLIQCYELMPVGIKNGVC